MIHKTIKNILVVCSVILLAFSCDSSGKNPVINPVDKPDNIPNQEMKLSRVDTVRISGMAFHPAELTVDKGDTVLWINEDIVPHNATAFPGNEWGSGTLNTGMTWKKAFDSNSDYYCSIHPTMKGKIVVK